MKRNRCVVLMVSLVLMVVLSASFLQAKNKSAAKLLKMEKQLTNALGTNTNWKPVVFKDLKLGMPWNKVRNYFPGLRCNASKKYDFPTCTGQKNIRQNQGIQEKNSIHQRNDRSFRSIRIRT